MINRGSIKSIYGKEKFEALEMCILDSITMNATTAINNGTITEDEFYNLDLKIALRNIWSEPDTLYILHELAKSGVDIIQDAIIPINMRKLITHGNIINMQSKCNENNTSVVRGCREVVECEDGSNISIVEYMEGLSDIAKSSRDIISDYISGVQLELKNNNKKVMTDKYQSEIDLLRNALNAIYGSKHKSFNIDTTLPFSDTLGDIQDRLKKMSDINTQCVITNTPMAKRGLFSKSLDSTRYGDMCKTIIVDEYYQLKDKSYNNTSSLNVIGSTLNGALEHREACITTMNKVKQSRNGWKKTNKFYK